MFINNSQAPYKFILDNNAPFIIYAQGKISDQIQLRSITSIKFPLRTPVGTVKQEIFETTDSFRLGNLFFKERFIHLVHGPKPEYFGDTISGLLGSSLFSSNAWRIDFEKFRITWASEAKPLKEVDGLVKIEASFIMKSGRKEVRIPIKIGGQKPVTCLLDLGYGGKIILPYKQFSKVAEAYPIVQRRDTISSLAGAKATEYVATEPLAVKVGGFETKSEIISTRDLALKTGVVGLSFLSQFRYLLIDYTKEEVFLVE